MGWSCGAGLRRGGDAVHGPTAVVGRTTAVSQYLSRFLLSISERWCKARFQGKADQLQSLKPVVSLEEHRAAADLVLQLTFDTNDPIDDDAGISSMQLATSISIP